MIPRHIDVNDRICLNKQMPTADMRGEVLLMNSEKGLFYGLDEIGSAISRMIAKPIRVSELCAQLRGEYDAEPTLIERDVLQFLNALATHDLIVFTPGDTV